MSIILVPLFIVLSAIIATIVLTRNLIFSTSRSHNPDQYSVKQHAFADLKKYRLLFTSVGLLSAFGVASYIYSYEIPLKEKISLFDQPVDISEEIYEYTPITKETNPTTAPPKPQKNSTPPTKPTTQKDEVRIQDQHVINEIDKTPEPDLNSKELTNNSYKEPIVDPTPIIDNNVYFTTPTMASFPGGNIPLQNKVSENLNKKLSSRNRNRIKDLPQNSCVYVSYIIEKDGTISDIKIERGLPILGLNEKVIESLKGLPKWNPARNEKGNPVRLRYTQKLIIN